MLKLYIGRMAKAIKDYIFQFHIEKVLDPTLQNQEMGVPQEYVLGHAYWYTFIVYL